MIQHKAPTLGTVMQVSSKIRWVQQFPNLVVLRTFSKSAGLAGIRVGYGGFPAGLIEFMWRAKQPYNVSAAAETAACAALSNKAYLEVCLTCFNMILAQPLCDR